MKLIDSAKCVLCGKDLGEVNVVEKINGIDYYFDKEECVLIFRRLESVYGQGFFTDEKNGAKHA
jgi:hypothetical protein